MDPPDDVEMDFAGAPINPLAVYEMNPVAGDEMEPLAGAHIHGFHTRAVLNIDKLKQEARSRWFMPNEVHAILSNPNLLGVQDGPLMEKPESGSLFVYNKKEVKNFRNDGYQWKKKKNGKTLQETQRKLQVGNEDRLYVCYARCQHDPEFSRRFYWFIEKEGEDDIVLVHYRLTSHQPSGALANNSQPLEFGLQLADLYEQDQEAPDLISDTLAEPFVAQNLFFNITDVSPGWAYCTHETKILIVGDFPDQFWHLHQSNLYCSIGGTCVKAEPIQPGVLRVLVPVPDNPGPTDLYITLDCENPKAISQAINFEYLPDYAEHTNGIQNPSTELEPKDILLQARLWHLLFSTNKIFSMSNLPQKQLEEATKFASQTSPLFEKYWASLINQINEGKATTKGLLDTLLRSKVQEWLSEKVLEGCKMPLDKEGQGVTHLCAMLDYVWAVWLFALSGFSLDFRDSAGWTALHWAAYYGRERMAARLLSAGANPSLVADPTPKFPGGKTAADIAADQMFKGLAAYLAEKYLCSHLDAMSLHSNVNSNISVPPTSKPENHCFPNNSEEELCSENELCLKDSLAAYRNAAVAADKIQAAFRERTFKMRTEAVQIEKPENEEEYMVAILRIHNAYRTYKTKKSMKDALRIHNCFSTLKTHRSFSNLRFNATKIQAAFRGHQARRKYKNIIWAVGVLEKAVLRWSRKKQGLRGFKPSEVTMRIDPDPSSSTGDEVTGEEDFFRISREHAEARIARSLQSVEALFQSYEARQAYRRVRMAHEEAQKEFKDASRGDWAI